MSMGTQVGIVIENRNFFESELKEYFKSYRIKNYGTQGYSLDELFDVNTLKCVGGKILTYLYGSARYGTVGRTDLNNFAKHCRELGLKVRQFDDGNGVVHGYHDVISQALLYQEHQDWFDFIEKEKANAKATRLKNLKDIVSILFNKLGNKLYRVEILDSISNNDFRFLVDNDVLVQAEGKAWALIQNGKSYEEVFVNKAA